MYIQTYTHTLWTITTHFFLSKWLAVLKVLKDFHHIELKSLKGNWKMELFEKTEWNKKREQSFTSFHFASPFCSVSLCTAFHFSALCCLSKSCATPTYSPLLTSSTSFHVPIKPGQVANALSLSLTFLIVLSWKGATALAFQDICMRWDFSGWWIRLILFSSRFAAALMFLFSQ